MAAEVTIAAPTGADAVELAANMRAEDAAEVMASNGQSPLDAVRFALSKSRDAWSVRFDGELAAIFGVAPVSSSAVLGRVGSVWMLTTDAVPRHKDDFLQACREVIPLLFDHWDLLFNYIDARYVRALRWAVKLGFQVEDPRPYGVAGLDFCRFTVTREDLRCATRS